VSWSRTRPVWMLRASPWRGTRQWRWLRSPILTGS